MRSFQIIFEMKTKEGVKITRATQSSWRPWQMKIFCPAPRSFMLPSGSYVCNHN